MNPSSQIIFKERQTFSRLWFLLILFLVPVLIYTKFQGEGVDFVDLLISISVIVGLSVLFVFSKLETTISHDEIQYRLFPFQWNMRKISKDQIAEAFVRKYSPLFEYGGWGLRWGINGKAINIRGNMGIQVVLKSGSRILIGTSNAVDAKKALEKLTEHPTT